MVKGKLGAEGHSEEARNQHHWINAFLAVQRTTENQTVCCTCNLVHVLRPNVSRLQSRWIHGVSEAEMAVGVSVEKVVF